MAKRKTNEQNIKALMKSLHTVEVALLVERMLTVSALTRRAIEKDASSFNTPFTNPKMFIDLCNKIDLHLKEKK